MLFENTIVGPIKSRRLGNSLGVNLLPLKHKICSYDCIYCECGWNKESEDADIEYVTPEQVHQMLEQRLIELKEQNAPIDSITFAGNGEPTLYPQFPEIVDIVIELRNKYYPNAMTTLLTNATQLTRPEIFSALKKLDNPTLKLDAGTADMRYRINLPNEKACSYEELKECLVRFGSQCIIQTLLFDGVTDEGETVTNIDTEGFAKYMEIVKQVRPKFVQLYALDRATPAKHLRKLSADELNIYAEKLRAEGIEVKIYG